MRTALRDRLCCPLCHGAFRWTSVTGDARIIRSAVVLCPSCGTRSEVRGEIGYFLPGDATEMSASPCRRVPPGAARAPVGRAAPADSPWEIGLREADRRARAEVAGAAGLTLEVATRTAVPRGSGPPGIHLAEDPRDLPAGSGADGPDRFVVDLHSLPFVNDAVDVAVVGPGLQEAPGPLVILRELHRTVGEKIAVVVAVPEGRNAAPPQISPRETPDPMFTEPGLLEEFRRARWTPRFVPVTEVSGSELAATEDPAFLRIGIIVAE